MTIAEALKRFREQNRLTQQQIADVLGLTRQAYLSYEYKGIPPSSAIVKIAQHYDVSADYLLGLSDNPKRNDSSKEITDSDRELVDIAISYHKALQAILDKRGLTE